MIQKIYTLTAALFLVNMMSAQITVTDADLGTGTYNWTADNEYLLDGLVYLEEGGVLNIEPGTVIRGKAENQTTGAPASALIITRGAKIFAAGTADNPIIFTGEFDDLSTSDDFTALDNQTWAGLILLGNAPVGEDGGEDAIEGISGVEEPRVLYGGEDPEDNSGVLKYISLRHGGSIFGADNEINGLTLGGVGNGTIIDFVEVFATKDDGIEIFGGTVNVKHAVVAFQGDDALDIDEAWDGFIQYAFTIQQDQDLEIGDNAVEYDGTEDAVAGAANPAGRIYNGTFIGSGVGAGTSNGLLMKKAGAAQFWNCVWTDMQGYVFRFEDESINRLDAGETVFANNIAFNYNNFQVNQDFTVPVGASTVNQADPNIASISRIPNNMLDPRPADNDALMGSGANTNVPAEAVGVEYRGAFGHNLWLEGWTALSEYNYLGNVSTYSLTSVDYAENVAGVKLHGAMPNPVVLNPAVFGYELPNASEVKMNIFTIQGQLVASYDLGMRSEGQNIHEVATDNMVNGMYIVALETEQGTVTQKFTVQK